jgi:hypothetical protein
MYVCMYVCMYAYENMETISNICCDLSANNVCVLMNRDSINIHMVYGRCNLTIGSHCIILC